MKIHYHLLITLSLLTFKNLAQENKRINLLPSFYSGINLSLATDDGNYEGGQAGVQGLLNNKHYFSAEGGMIWNDNIPPMETGNYIRQQIYFESTYGRPIYSSKSQSFKIIWQTGLQVRQINYRGKYLYTEGWFGAVIYEEKNYWQAAIPLRIKTMITSRYVGLSFDLYTLISKPSHVGCRINWHLGLLKNKKALKVSQEN